MGPAFETFIGALLIIVLAIIPLVLVFRKPCVRLYHKLCEQDQKELAEVQVHEQECLQEQEARKLAMNELARDCYPSSDHERQDKDVQQAVKLVDRNNEKREL